MPQCSTYKRIRARIQLCVYACTQLGVDWFVIAGHMRVQELESLLVYTPASIRFSQGSLCNLHRVTQLMMAVCCRDLFHTAGIPSLLPLQRSNLRLAVRKAGRESPICDLCNTHRLQVQTASFNASCRGKFPQRGQQECRAKWERYLTQKNVTFKLLGHEHL